MIRATLILMTFVFATLTSAMAAPPLASGCSGPDLQARICSLKATGDMAHCDALEAIDDKAYCLAIKHGMPNYCNRIMDEGTRKKCMSEAGNGPVATKTVARTIGDTSKCESVKSNQMAYAECFARAGDQRHCLAFKLLWDRITCSAISKKDPGGCDDVQGDQRAFCKAVVSNTPSACSAIADSSYKAYCQARTTGSNATCSTIGDPAIARACSDRFGN